MEIEIIVVILLIAIGGLFAFKYIIGYGKNEYTSAEKRKLVEENEFISNNKERLTKIFDEKYEILKPIKIYIIISGIAFVIFVVLSFIIKEEMLTYISIGITLVILFFNLYNYRSKSYNIYNEIVKEVLHDFDSDLEYNPSGGFSANEYNLCRFPETCDVFSSEDLIINTKKDFQYADILIESKHEDSDDRTYYVKEFEGSLARIKIKDIGCRIFLGGIKTTSIFSKDDCMSIKFENDEFNDLFMAYSDNEIQAYKILTPDIMEEFVNIKKAAFSDIDIRILNSNLYVRFPSGDGFDCSEIGKNTDRDKLCQSIAVLEDIMKTMDNIKSIIDKKNMD